LRSFNPRFLALLASPLLLIGIALSSCSSSNTSRDDGNSSKSNSQGKSGPATNDDIYLYRGIGASFLCNALSSDIDFPKAVGIAATTYAQVLNGRHGGYVKSAGSEKLTNRQLFAGAEFQIITGAIQYCPDDVPSDIKDKVDAAIKNQSESK
tara:strand:- start:7057 stop:7512 length:456 start_codon:yes stop_codon:yes gene_type:complete